MYYINLTVSYVKKYLLSFILSHPSVITRASPSECCACLCSPLVPASWQSAFRRSFAIFYHQQIQQRLLWGHPPSWDDLSQAGPISVGDGVTYLSFASLPGKSSSCGQAEVNPWPPASPGPISTPLEAAGVVSCSPKT